VSLSVESPAIRSNLQPSLCRYDIKVEATRKADKDGVRGGRNFIGPSDEIVIHECVVNGVVDGKMFLLVEVLLLVEGSDGSVLLMADVLLLMEAFTSGPGSTRVSNSVAQKNTAYPYLSALDGMKRIPGKIWL
jgi:hypothetical protein